MDLAKIRKKAKKKESVVREPARKAVKARDQHEPEKILQAIAESDVPPEMEASPPVQAPSASAAEEAPRPSPAPSIGLPAKIDVPPQPEPEAQQAVRDRKLEKLLVFKVGRNRYAITIDDLSQIIDDRALTPLPHVPDFLKGIFALRGHIVGVLDVSERLDLPPLPDSAMKKIIVLEKGGDLFGLRVENIEHVVEVDISSLEAPPESFDAAQQEFVMGVFHYKNKTVAFLNLPMFLDFNVSGRI